MVRLYDTISKNTYVIECKINKDNISKYVSYLIEYYKTFSYNKVEKSDTYYTNEIVLHI